MDVENIERYDKAEEIANAVTHGIAGVFSIAALVLMIVFSAVKGTAAHVVGSAIFGSSLIILYTASTIYHALTHKKAKYVFEILDHSAIYILIAGTYTPFTLTALRGPVGWTLFGVIWGMAAIGIAFKAFFVRRFMVVSTLIYIAMGWTIIFVFSDLKANFHENGIFLLALGGVLYTVGTIFYMWRKMRFHHALWHLFVMAGSFCHVFSVMLYLIPVLS